MPLDPIRAIGLLTQRDLDVLGQGFDRAFPVRPDVDFADLLKAIDEADRKLKVRNRCE